MIDRVIAEAEGSSRPVVDRADGEHGEDLHGAHRGAGRGTLDRRRASRSRSRPTGSRAARR